MSTAAVIGFWSGAAILVALALLFLLPPLLRPGARRTGPDSREVNAAVYRARLQELEREVEDGTLDPSDLGQAQAELEREILDTLESGSAAGPASRPPKFIAAGIAALVPALALGIYLALGEPGAVGPVAPPAPPGSTQSPDGAMDRAALERMTRAFAERLEESPHEGESWLVLARSYVMLDQFDKAVEAFANANALLGDTPEILLDYAEAEAMANGNRFSAKARGRIDKALSLAPENEKGLWLAAFAAAQHGEIDSAVDHWQALLQREREPGRRRIIEGLIARVQGSPGAPAAPPAVASAPAPVEGATVSIRVRLDDALRGGLDGSETVFIFARDAKGRGAPLAVHRTRVNALPATITLDDSMSMVPSLKVSDREQVMVTARVSLSGDARPASGDLQGSAGPIAVGNEAPVVISIDRRVP